MSIEELEDDINGGKNITNDYKGSVIKFHCNCFQTLALHCCSLKHEPKLHIAPILQELKL